MEDTPEHGNSIPIAGIVSIAIVAAVIGNAIYNIYFHPLSKRKYSTTTETHVSLTPFAVPGPKLLAANNFTYWYYLVTGNILPWCQSLHEKYGEVVRLGSNKVSYINPQAWKDICGHRAHGKFENTKDTHFHIPGENGQHSILSVPSSEEHGRLRKMFSNAFSDKALRQQEPLITQYVDKLVSVVDKAARSQPNAMVNLVELYNCTTFDIIADLVFGEPLGLLESSALSPWVKFIFAHMKTGTILSLAQEYPALAKLFELLTPKSLIEKQKMHRRHTSDRVDKRLSSGIDRPDIWDLILKKAAGSLSLREQYANAEIFMVGGSETTATLLSGLTYLFLTNPDKMAKAVAEVRALPRDALNFQGVAHLPYLQACLEETLRLYPPVPVAMPRETAPGGSSILGEWLPEGTSLHIYHYVAYHSPLNFKDPNAFVPERWMGDNRYDSDRKDVLQPFSFGPRNCLGKNLAYHEMRLIMASILWNFDLELSPECTDWFNQKAYIIWEKNDLMVKVKPIH
ncbi:Cytochrome P450 monooxygenase hmp1 [Lasiodiplodia hormozganensis]|uniref:Cytochrome P450 monooxygenase hmp1 n=1 Tax=Lasiodiplodia hormozganensis TaxID=869390 RepID=A0AA40CPV0_9PEZI|nr:Cytochrome P450 monooxygenase hmp1 [Lasiodiplodia hormozganensis]